MMKDLNHFSKFRQWNNSGEDDNALWNCCSVFQQQNRPKKQSRYEMLTLLLPNLSRNFGMANSCERI